MQDRATILEGGCHVSLGRLVERTDDDDGGAIDGNDLDMTTRGCNQFDRISLGLLPSSEGGWVAAVSCLR